MSAKVIHEIGNFYNINFSDGTQALAYPTGSDLFQIGSNTNGATFLQVLGNSIKISYDAAHSPGTTNVEIAYPTNGRNLWYVSERTPPVYYVPPVDTISPGHVITNPGGTILSGWNWHLANESGGGDDWNYSYGTNFAAPGAGTVSHFDVSGVGMVVKLILNTPAVRTQPQFTSDAFGPMTAIWFEHCSASFDGTCNEGDIIGQSGDGYGAYPAHLHVHGLINNGNSAPAISRCCFWNFV